MPHEPDLSRHAEEKYLPKPKTERTGIALCLSGGGYRAILFHLGALRRLNELNILSKVSTISSVSGGSILAGFLASRIDWPVTAPILDWRDKLEVPGSIAYKKKHQNTGNFEETLALELV